MNTDSRYASINEFTAGFGLGDTRPAFAKGYFGIITTECYQINKDLLGGIGTGVSFYNKGFLVPLFLHFRMRVLEARWVPYFFGDGGFMLDFSHKNSRAFLNPGIGVTYALSSYLGLDLGTGLFVQWGNCRDSYFSLKSGVVYKF